MAGPSDFDVAYVARLTRIDLTDDEAEIFQRQLDRVLKYVEKLRELDLSGVNSAVNARPVCNVFREDAPRDWFTAAQALSNAPRQANGLFVVPKVVE